MSATQDPSGQEAGRTRPGWSPSRTDASGYLTASQLAERWQVPITTIYAWARRNLIPHYRAGRLLRFDAHEVEECFRRQGFAEEIVADDEHPGESAFSLLTA